MRKFLTPAVTVLLLSGLASSPAIADATQTRPIQGSVAAEFYVDGTCDDGSPWQVIEGGGIASHLGAFTSEGGACLTEPPSPASVTWMAANGDEIHIVFITVPTGEPGPDGSIPVELVVLDLAGSGRFENVALDATAIGTVTFDDPVSGHIEFTVEGTITYDASNRRH